MPNVIEINDIDELARYRTAWEGLLAETPLANFFQSLDWLEVYWRHFGSRQKLRALIVESEGRLIGIVPLVVRTEASRLGSVRVLSYPLDDWGTFYGPIGPDARRTLEAAFEHIHATPRDWDVIDIRYVDRSRSDQGETAAAIVAAGYASDETVWETASVVEFQSGWDAYWASLDTHWRTNVRRSEKKLAAQGKVEFVRYRPAGELRGDADPRWDLFEACLRIAGESWQGNSTSGTTLSHAAIVDFLRDVHAAAVRCGCVDLNLLYVDGKPAAFAYNYVFNGHVYGLRMGFDPSVTRDGAGSVLMHRMMADSFARGDRVFDLGPGSQQCKRHWRTALVPSYRYMHFPRFAARAQALRVGRQVRSWLGSRRESRAAKK